MLVLTDHAAHRLRKRVGGKLRNKPHHALRQVITELVAPAPSVEVQDFRGEKHPYPTELRAFMSAAGEEFVAVIRGRVVVTVLEGWMADRNFPGWRDI